MATVVWPPSLPQFVQEAGYSEQAPKNLEETEMDAGQPKARRRFTKVYRRLHVSILLQPGQDDTFETFYYTTCASGSIPFQWVHPRTQTAMNFRFTNPPPTYQVTGGINTRVSFNLLEVD